MRILKVDIPGGFLKDMGLKAVRIARLQEVVLLAGKNGAGKTRFLKVLQNILSHYPSNRREAEILLQSNQHERNLVEWQRELDVFKTYQDSRPEDRITQLTRAVESTIPNLALLKEELKYKDYLQLNGDKDATVVYFVPTSTHLIDSYDMSSAALVENAKKIETDSMEDLAQGVIAAITQIQKTYFTVTHPNRDRLEVTDDQIADATTKYDKLCKYIYSFLGTELKSDSSLNPTLFGKRIGQAGLSDGQIVLLQFCLALYAREEKLENLVIFMDEPENHLHPEALLYVLDQIVRNIPNGQLWIATHSINILAHFDPECIYYIENGEINYSGNVPDRVLKGLMGDEDETEKLRQFLSVPTMYSLFKYAYESLIPPKIIINGNEDPQNSQIRDQVESLRAAEEEDKIKVLDIGMGKGRLLWSIQQTDIEKGLQTSKWLDYVGYDINRDNHQLWEPIFNSVYGSTNGRFYTDFELLLNEHGKTFDIAVLCNVLHEIDPSGWKNLFIGNSSVSALLNNDGYLLLLEDQLMPIGEHANDYGFLLFGKEQLCILFGVDPTSNEIYESSYESKGRLNAYRIPQKLLSNITDETVVAAIDSLNKVALAKIQTVRLEKASYQNARIHALWLQLFANSSVFLRKKLNEGELQHGPSTRTEPSR